MIVLSSEIKSTRKIHDSLIKKLQEFNKNHETENTQISKIIKELQSKKPETKKIEDTSRNI